VEALLDPAAAALLAAPAPARTEVEVISQYYAWYRSLMGTTAG
jgi:hypothetical protein